jgi:hypothetical protein
MTVALKMMKPEAKFSCVVPTAIVVVTCGMMATAGEPIVAQEIWKISEEGPFCRRKGKRSVRALDRGWSSSTHQPIKRGIVAEVPLRRART